MGFIWKETPPAPDPRTTDTIGGHMRRARLRCGYSVHELADASGVGENSIYAYERNQVDPGLYNLIQLADVLGVSLDQYIGRVVKSD